MTALYRRYRPDSFADVIGQAHVTEPLRHALNSGRIHHAYLFSGPRGCGKTTSARVLARCLNCEQGPTDTPCGTCASCVELARDGGGSLDVVEIDAASHNGVDDARELRERAIFAPARDRFKIFILDEAHMVTQQGFNALLKIVEEPPEHVKFIFATTEPEKVLTTIRSRTHHYPFRLVAPGELLTYLETVLSAENVTVDEGVLALAIRSGGGSVRDTLSLLDQLIAGSSDSHISLASAQALLGYTPSSFLDQVMTAIFKSDAKQGFSALHELLEAGHDPRRFVEDFLSHLRDVIVVQATAGEAKDLFPGVSDEDFERWSEKAGWFSPEALSSLAHVVSSALSDMSGVTSPRLQLELLVAELMSPKARSSAVSSLTPSEQVEPTPRSDSNASAAPKHDDVQTTEPDTLSQESSEKDIASEDAGVEPISPWELSVVQSLWPGVLDELASSKRLLWVAMSGTSPLKLEGDVLTIGFAKRGDAEILKKPQGPGSPLPNADLLREAIFAKSGHRLRFTVEELPRLDQEGVAAVETGDTWPVVTTAEPPAALTSPNDDTVAGDGVPESVAGESPEASSEPTTPIATRGEPVVRQLLGGELVGEEILDEMSAQGEADV